MITSANTSINKTKVPEIFKLVEKKHGWQAGSYNLDIGGGKYDTATEYLESFGVTNLVYDPFNRSYEHNKGILDIAEERFVETITISNVLNVIKDRTQRIKLLKSAKKYLEYTGKLYVTCYQAKKPGLSKKDCWQNALPLAFYEDEIKEVFGIVRRFGRVLYTIQTRRRRA